MSKTYKSRWYVLSKSGLATLCANRDDAEEVAKRCAADYMLKLIGKDKGSWPKVFVIYEGAYTELIKTELSRHLVHLDYEPMFKSTQIKG